MNPDFKTQLNAFVSSGPFAVVGASADREKYGNKVLRCYQQHQMEVYPVNPKADRLEGLQAYASLAELPRRARSISIITPPEVTEKVVQEAIRAGVKNIWMQPGSESPAAVQAVKAAGLELIAHGPCILVALGFKD